MYLRKEEPFVNIEGEKGWHYGGNQAWFTWEGRQWQSHVARQGACGTVALANIAAYLARSNPVYAGLYPYPDYMVRRLEAPNWDKLRIYSSPSKCP